MEQVLERVKDELCGNYIVVTTVSESEEKISREDLMKLFNQLLDHTFAYSNGRIYIHI